MTTYPTFTPTYEPDAGMSESHNPRMREYKFGDGYEQVGKYGVNNDQIELNPKWTNEPDASGQYIRNFLKERAGRPFWYQPNAVGELKCFRCKQWTAARKRGSRWDITATFTETAGA